MSIISIDLQTPILRIQLLFAIAFLFIVNPLIGKTDQDSLWDVWSNTKLPDTSRLQALTEFTWDGYLFNDPDSAFYYAQIQIDYATKKGLNKYVAKALNTQGASHAIRNNQNEAIEYYLKSIKYHEKSGYKKGVASVLNNIGNIQYDQGEYDDAITSYSKSLKILTEIGDEKSVSLAQNNIGNVYSDRGDYVNALDYFNKALKTSEKLNDTNGIANAFNNIGIIYNNIGEYEEAAQYFEKSLKLFQTNSTENKLAIAYNLNNLGNTYSYLSDNDKALKYYHRSLELYEEIGGSYTSGNTLNNIGTIYFDRAEYDTAYTYFKESYELFQSYEDESGSIIPMNNMGRIEFERGNNSKAIRLSSKALKIAEEVGNIMGINHASEFLYEVYKKAGNKAKALEMHELYLSSRDSILSEENQRRVLRQEFQYEYEKKAVADSLKALEESIIASAKIATQEAQLEKEKTQRYALSGGILLLLIFGGVTYNRFRITSKQKDIIADQKTVVEMQKNLVEVKNREILDSINYARRIQRAILPPAHKMDEIIGDHFVLYKPKDVVAGDFYWLEHLDEGYLVAVADCTGHGVPGALVSVICNNGLNRSVREYGFKKPDEILNKTREIVVKEFERSEEEVKDGMDIALIGVRGKKLHFAGAHNPLWHIRNGKINVIKADKQPIGKFHVNKPFTNHEIDLEDGDSIYIFSDGYVDQFGGNNGKKFMAKRLRKLILDIIDLPMEEQKKVLSRKLDEWKGAEDQIDDVCMIGIKV